MWMPIRIGVIDLVDLKQWLDEKLFEYITPEYNRTIEKWIAPHPPSFLDLIDAAKSKKYTPIFGLRQFKD